MIMAKDASVSNLASKNVYAWLLVPILVCEHKCCLKNAMSDLPYKKSFCESIITVVLMWSYCSTIIIISKLE